MKKALCLLLALVLCLSLCACKSEAATQVDDMILAIGTVTLDSESNVKAVEAAYNALTQEQKDELENYALLVAARTTLDDLLEKKRLEEAEAARIAALKAEAASVDSMISAIGEVTPDKADAIIEARNAVNALSPEGQEFLNNVGILMEAEAALMVVRAQEVTAIIESLGTVTLESGDAIRAAESKFNALSEDEKLFVANAGTLTAAREEYDTKLANFAEPYLKRLKLEEDKVWGNKFYYASGFPYYDAYGYWGADVRSFALPYMGTNGSSVWLRLVFNYTAYDWIFFETITIAVDGQRYFEVFDYFDVTRDNDWNNIWEYVDVPVNSYEMDILRAIANSNEAIIRFEGDRYYDDVTITAADKKAISEMLLLYEYMQNK